MEYPPTERNDTRFLWICLSLAAVMLIIALAVALDIGSPESDGLPEGEFLAQADQVCAKARREFEKVQSGQPATPGEAEELASDLLAIANDEQEQLKSLGAPDELEDAVDRYLKAREEGIGLIRDGVDAARDRDAFAYEKAQADVAAGQVRRLQLARDLGLDECSRILGERDELANDARAPDEATPQGAPPTIADPPTGAP